MSENNTNVNKQTNNEEKQKRRRSVVRAVILTIIIIILLLLRCCGNGDEEKDPTIGDFTISDSTKEPTIEDVQPTETQTITFVGRGEYFVSEESPDIELRNSEKNKDREAYFVFTVIDVKTNNVIARTGEVAPGQYVYVDVMNYFVDPGDYDILISIRVTDKNGKELNGMNQEAVLHVLGGQ